MNLGASLLVRKKGGEEDQVKDEQEFLDRHASITKAIMNLDYICGYCYTQITDVQQEVNRKQKT
ncbi:hypothetical protein [Fictibacillus terranigra]|uniref:hypothetical protein n=1 Tax=Fictibacillus terranigra TaxID=3058424 RepID=UPI003CD0E27E